MFSFDLARAESHVLDPQMIGPKFNRKAGPNEGHRYQKREYCPRYVSDTTSARPRMARGTQHEQARMYVPMPSAMLPINQYCCWWRSSGATVSVMSLRCGTVKPWPICTVTSRQVARASCAPALNGDSPTWSAKERLNRCLGGLLLCGAGCASAGPPLNVTLRLSPAV